MFVIGSSGRCGTVALIRVFRDHSDHEVGHEPEPRLLREALRKHEGKRYRTRRFRRRMAWLAERDGTAYGETWRAPNLLADVAKAAPNCRFLILVRDPLEYVVSAHYMKVLQRGDEWDRMRLMPHRISDDATLAKRLVLHWKVVNRYLLDFAHAEKAPVVTVPRDLDEHIDRIAELLGVTFTDRNAVRSTLALRPNKAQTREVPAGWDPDRLRSVAGDVWREAQETAERTDTAWAR